MQPYRSHASKVGGLHRVSRQLIFIMLVVWLLYRLAGPYLPAEAKNVLIPYTYYYGWIVWGAIVLFVFSAVMNMMLIPKYSAEPSSLFICWFIYLCFIASFVIFFDAFRISSIGIIGAAVGPEQSPRESLDLLFGSYPYLPLVSLNAVVVILVEPTTTLYISTQVPSVAYNYIVFGILFMTSVVIFVIGRQNRSDLIFVTVFLLVGIFLSYSVQSNFSAITYKLPGEFVAVAPYLCLFLAHCAIVMTGFMFYRAIWMIASRPANSTNRIYANLLPPPAFSLLLAFFFMLPLLGDIESVHRLARAAYGPLL